MWRFLSLPPFSQQTATFPTIKDEEDYQIVFTEDDIEYFKENNMLEDGFEAHLKEINQCHPRDRATRVLFPTNENDRITELHNFAMYFGESYDAVSLMTIYERRARIRIVKQQEAEKEANERNQAFAGFQGMVGKTRTELQFEEAAKRVQDELGGRNPNGKRVIETNIPTGKKQLPK